MDYPLADLKVLDFSRVLAGPYAGRMLSDLGADVVKVEPPEGDVTRYWGHVIGGLPGYYNQQNAGKRNICVDLRATGAKDLILDLVRHADIVIENYRPDVMGRLGIDYPALSSANPRLIMLSISGFGPNGPESRRPTYAPVIHAEAGLVARLAHRSGQPHSDFPTSLADTNAALHGLVGILAALHYRDLSGLGQHIDIAMMDATIGTDDQLHYDLEGSHDTGPLPNDIWETPIGPILLSTDFRYLWNCLTTQRGLEDPSDPDMPRQQRIALRRKATAKFMQTLATREAVVELMDAFNIPWGDVRQGKATPEQITLRHRSSFTEVDDRAGGKRTVTQSPYRFSNAKSGVRGPAPHQGEHNAEVLKQWLGADQSRIHKMQEEGILLTDEKRAR